VEVEGGRDGGGWVQGRLDEGGGLGYGGING